ncbi:hypothetical protein [Campylobacter geochelonis]|uniref:hypothetical protein n=1 Tax=Campylobacter geochelonis TaxID=1780362 RepID=UPI0007706FF3|nr:hypothetical protein [Campylobacter geochelonis]CZE51176.1 putative GTP pyrophosphokinase [Campylobacter geochelonis]
MKVLFYAFITAFFISGCSIFSLTSAKPQTPLAPDGEYLATIDKFTITTSTPKLYTYFFTYKGKSLKAISPKYYYKSNDIALIKVKNSIITSMLLLKRESKSKPQTLTQPAPYKKEKIIKKKVAPSKISIPKTQSISF